MVGVIIVLVGFQVQRLHSNDPNEQKRLRKVILDPSKTEVVVTTYDSMKSTMRSAVRGIVWRSVFLDEGHRVKNEATGTAQACSSLHARFKVSPAAAVHHPIAHCLLPTAHYPLPTTHCPLPTAHYPLPTARFLLLSAFILVPRLHFSHMLLIACL